MSYATARHHLYRWDRHGRTWIAADPTRTRIRKALGEAFQPPPAGFALGIERHIVPGRRDVIA